MIEKDIKVEPKNDDITRTMFLSVYTGFKLKLTKDYDDYFLSLDIMSHEDKFSAYWDDYYVYKFKKIISLGNVSEFTEDIIKQLNQSVLSQNVGTNTSTSIINTIILNYLSDIKDELKGLLLEVANGCDFCLGYENLDILSINGNTLTIDTYNPEKVKINYCPICGRKLKDD